MSLQADVAWLRAHTPLTREAAERLAGRHLDFPPGIHLFPAEVERAVVANSQ